MQINHNKGNSEAIGISPQNFTSLAALRTSQILSFSKWEKMQFFNLEFLRETKDKSFSETQQYNDCWTYVLLLDGESSCFLEPLQM